MWWGGWPQQMNIYCKCWCCSQIQMRSILVFTGRVRASLYCGLHDFVCWIFLKALSSQLVTSLILWWCFEKWQRPFVAYIMSMTSHVVTTRTIVPFDNSIARLKWFWDNLFWAAGGVLKTLLYCITMRGVQIQTANCKAICPVAIISWSTGDGLVLPSLGPEVTRYL